MSAVRRGRTFRHGAMLDLDMHVLRIENITDDEYWLEVMYVYRRDPNMLIGPDRVRIKRADWKNWEMI